MRSREFLMKDGLFHTSQESLAGNLRCNVCGLQQNLQPHGAGFPRRTGRHRFYRRQRLHEFRVLAQSGEDDVVFSDTSDYAANIELAEAIAPKEPPRCCYPGNDAG